MGGEDTGLPNRLSPIAMVSTIRQHAGAALVAAGLLTAAFAEGLFNPSGYAAASIGWASDEGRAFEEAVRVSFFLGLFVLVVCTGTRAGRAEWVAGLTAGLGLIAVVALFAYLQPAVLDSG